MVELVPGAYDGMAKALAAVNIDRSSSVRVPLCFYKFEKEFHSRVASDGARHVRCKTKYNVVAVCFA